MKLPLATHDTDPMLATGRRHLWESFGDVRAMNTFLVIYSICASLALVGVVFVLIKIFTRPPYILSQEEGVVMWRSTETFKLRKDMVSQFLRTTLGAIYNQTPSDYDLTPIAPYIDTKILDVLSGKSAEGSSTRIRSDQRQFFNILGIRRVADSKYPQFITVIVKADQTVMSESRDNSGNVITSSQSSIVYVSVYMDQRLPTPENPWGLHIVGLEKGDSGEIAHVWDSGLPLVGTKDKKGEVIK